MALKYHPDRVNENQRKEAAAKFSIIHNAYSVLSDSEKKRQYDEGSDILFTKQTLAAQWENYLKPMDSNDIELAKLEYQGSEQENLDLIREFKNGNGSVTHLLNNIPFMRVEDENRIIESIRELQSQGKLPKLSIKKISKK